MAQSERTAWNQFEVYQAPFERREAELAEIDRFNDMQQPAFEQYVGRLENAQAHIQNKVRQAAPQANLIRHRLLNEANLRQGLSNYWANPTQYISPESYIAYDPRQRQEGIEAWVHGNNPERIYIRPDPTDMKYSPTPRLLAHEAAHTRQLALENRDIRQKLTTSRSSTDFGWEPKFSLPFLQRLSQESLQEASPFYGRGFGSNPKETMGYLIGREAELPQGQTLMDDPVSRRLFEGFPGMYDEYVISRDRIRDKYIRTRRGTYR